MFPHALHPIVFSPGRVHAGARLETASTPSGRAVCDPRPSGTASSGACAVARRGASSGHRRRRRRLSWVALLVGLTLVLAAPVGASSTATWTPTVARSVQTIAHRFGVQAATYPGHDPDQWHAADFWVHSSAQGYALAGYARAHAARLHVHYICWHRHIWNIQRAGQGWRLMADRGSPTQNHMNHVHVSFY